MSGAARWLLARDSPALLTLHVVALVAVWMRLSLCSTSIPRWTFLAARAYLVAGMLWALTSGGLIVLGAVEPSRYGYLAAPSVYLVHMAVIVFCWTDRRRIIARHEAMACQIRRAEELVRSAERE